MMNGTASTRTIDWRRLELLAFVAAGVGFLCTIVGAAFGLGQAFRSYLTPYLFWLGVSLGSLVIIMLHNVTGGMWGLAIRPLLVSATRALPMLALLFVPIAVGAHFIYPWVEWTSAGTEFIEPSKRWYFSIPMFAVRAGIYFAVWCGIEYFLIRRTLPALPSATITASHVSLESASGDIDNASQRQLSAVGLVLYGLTLTLAAVDWIMSLDVDWYSTIFGMITAATQVLSALALAIIALSLLPTVEWKVARDSGQSDIQLERASPSAAPEILHDLGNLLWAFTMIWGYLTFSQFLIIWSGNLPEEIPWYLRRSVGGWQWFVAALVALYAVAFLSLVSRGTKRCGRKLAIVASGLFCMCFVAQYWTVAPAFHPGQFYVHWLDLAECVALSGLWLGAFAHQLKLRIG